MSFQVAPSEAVALLNLSMNFFTTATSRGGGRRDSAPGMELEINRRVYAIACEFQSQMRELFEKQLEQEFESRFETLEEYKLQMKELYEEYGEPSQDDLKAEYENFKLSRLKELKRINMDLGDPGRAV